MQRRAGRLPAPPCSLPYLSSGKSNSRKSSLRARRKGRVIIAVVCATSGTCGLLAWVRLPSSGTPSPLIGSHARCLPVLAVQRQPGRHARGRRWHSGQSSGTSTQQKRKSFVHFFSVVALGFFSWADKPEPVAAEEVGPSKPSHRALDEANDAIRTFLLNEVSTSSGHDSQNSRRDFLFFKRFIGQGSQAGDGNEKGNRRQKRKDPREDDVARSRSSKGLPEASQTRVTTDADGIQRLWPRGSTLDLAYPLSSQAEDSTEQEDSSGGLLAFFAAIKAAVFSVLFGDRDREEEEESDEDSVDEAKPHPEPEGALPVPSFELPKPEVAQDWLSSTWGGLVAEPVLQEPSSPARLQVASPRQAAVEEAVAKDEGRQESKEKRESEEVQPEKDRPSSAAMTEAQSPEVSLASLPAPDVPGLDEADLVVQVDIKPKTQVAKVQGEEGMQRLMRQNGGDILATMGQSGWKVETIDESRNLYALSLPAVRYDLPGCRVSIPSPVFETTIYDSFQKTGDYEERLQGDLVLQNGKDILTVDFKFPFNKTFTISAAGWTRSRVGWEGGAVKISNYLEIGLQVPKVPGLEKIMQLFVNQYGTESTLNCAVALADGADVIDLDEPEWWESAQQAVSDSARGITDALSAAVPAENKGDKTEEAEVLPEVKAEQQEPTEEAPEEVPSPSSAGLDKVEPAEPEWWESGLAMLNTKEQEEEEDMPGDQTPSVEVAQETVPRDAVPDPADHPNPVAPGMDEANLVVHTEVDPKSSVAESGEDGVDRLMAQSGGAILKTMAQEGWKVETVDESKNLYEMSLPAVRYEVAGAVVSIPSPRFLTTVYNTCRAGDDDYEERLFGDLVLQNGQDILTVELGFPFKTSFTISAAGWCRAVVGREKGSIVISAIVEIGLQLPKFPGLDSIMKYFVKAYGSQSTEDCSQALARGADALPPEGAPPEWLQSGIDAVAESIGSVLETVPELPAQDVTSSQEEGGRARRAS